MPLQPLAPRVSSSPGAARDVRQARLEPTTPVGALRPIARPALLPTHVLPVPSAQHLPSPGAKPVTGNRLSRIISRIGMSSEAKASRVHVALIKAKFFRRANFSKEIGLRTLTHFYGHDANTSRLLQTPAFNLQDLCPFLSDKQVAGIRRLFIDRAYTEVADPELLHENELQALERFFRDDKDRERLYNRVLKLPNEVDLFIWHNAHCDSVIFKLGCPVYSGPTTSIHVGLTRRHHPVTIKTIMHRDPHLDEEKYGRELSLYGATAKIQKKVGDGYKTFLLLPLASGDLFTLGTKFVPEYSFSTPVEMFGVRYLLHSLLSELFFMHEERRYVHNDIKPQNIFIHKQLRRPVFADFAMAAPLKADGTASCRGYTLATASPEQIFHGRITAKSDVFSLAVTLLNVVIQSPLFQIVTLNMYGGKPSDTRALFQGEREDLGAAHRSFRVWCDNFGPEGQRKRLAAGGRAVSRSTLTKEDEERCRYFSRIFRVLERLDCDVADVLRGMLRPSVRARVDAKAALEDARARCPLQDGAEARVSELFEEFSQGPDSFRFELGFLEKVALPRNKQYALA